MKPIRNKVCVFSISLVIIAPILFVLVTFCARVYCYDRYFDDVRHEYVIRKDILYDIPSFEIKLDDHEAFLSKVLLHLSRYSLKIESVLFRKTCRCGDDRMIFYSSCVYYAKKSGIDLDTIYSFYCCMGDDGLMKYAILKSGELIRISVESIP